MSVTIQMLNAGNEAVLQFVAPDVFDDPIDPAAAAAFLADANHHLAVAIDDGLVIGFVSAVRYFHPDKPKPELWINEVGVAEAYRGQGIARRLMEAVLNEARQQGCSEAWVLTNRSNHAAMRLYASSGGSEADDDVVMFEFKLPTRKDAERASVSDLSFDQETPLLPLRSLTLARSASLRAIYAKTDLNAEHEKQP